MNAAGSRSSPLLSGVSVSADDRPRQGRTLSDLLSRSSPSSAASKSPVLNPSLTLPSNPAMNGRVDYFPARQLTSEPESEVSTPPLSASPSELPQLLIPNSRSNSKIQVKTEMPTPSPKHSPKVQSPGDSPRPATSPTFPPPVSRSLSTSSVLRMASLSDADKKRNTLQTRVHKARKRIPRHIPLRVFRDPSECIEVDEVLKEMGM